MAENHKKSQEEYERIISDLFLSIYNQKYGTDYLTGDTEDQNSIIDRRGLSKSHKFPELKLQIKEIKKRDQNLISDIRKELPKKSHRGVVAFNVSIFDILKGEIFRAVDLYKDDPCVGEMTLVLVVNVSYLWMSDWIMENSNIHYLFKDIFCLALPTSNYGAYIERLQ